MPVQVIEEVKTKEVSFLEDVDVEYVSLVRHGANQMPFRVIKEEGGGAMGNTMIVQRVLVAKGLDLKGVSSMAGAEWLADANLEKASDKGAYHVSEQADLDLFNHKTLKMIKVHDDGVWVLAGEVKEGVDPKNLLALGAVHTKVAKEMLVPPMDAAVPMPAAMQTAVSFRELFFKELDSMLDVVIGSLNQSAGDLAKRKMVVLTAIDSFRAFLSIGLDSLGGESAKIEKIEANKTTKEEVDMFKDKAEFEAAVKSLVQPILDEAMKGVRDEIAKMAKTAEPAPAAPADDPAPAAPAAEDAVKAVETKVMEAVSAVTAKVDELVKKWDNAPATDPAATQPDPAPVKKTDAAKVSPFAGMLTKR